MAEGGFISKEIEDFPESVRSLMKIRNKTGPNTLPWGTPAMTGKGDDRVQLRNTHWQGEWRKSVMEEWSWPWIP